MNEHLILKQENLPLDSYFKVTIDKVDDLMLTGYKWPKMKYVFDYSLPITQEYVVDGICKKVDNVYHVINIYLPPITKLQYGAKQLAKLAFLKKNRINKAGKTCYNPDLKQLVHILLKIAPNNDYYFIYNSLPIKHLYLLNHLFKTIYFDYSLIDDCYHVYCKQFVKLDVVVEYQLQDIITYENTNFVFIKMQPSFNSKLLRLKNRLNHYFASLVERENIYLEERIDNQKKFSISISKEVKRRLIEAVNLAKALSLPLSELYLNFDSNNCMIYRLNRFFPFLKDIDNNNFLITEEGLYSVSRPKEAELISKKIKQVIGENTRELVLVDMTANVGGNVLNFCNYFSHVYAFELQWLNYLILQNNIRVAKLQDKCTIIHGNSLQFVDKYKFDVIFFDPPWGGVNYKEQTSVDLYLGDKSMVNIVIDLLAKNLSKLIAIKVPYNYNFNGFKDAGIEYTSYKINNLLLVII